MTCKGITRAYLIAGIVIASAVLCSYAALADTPEDTARYAVGDDETAIKIAKAVLRPLIGAAAIDGPHALPFYATEITSPGNYYYVENAPPARLQWVTPVIRVEINKADGSIIKVINPTIVNDPVYHERDDVWVIMTTPEDVKKWAPQGPPCVQNKSPSGETHYQCHDVIAHDITKIGFAPDEKTAIEIAKDVLRLFYGEDSSTLSLPFQATLKNGVWFIEDASSRTKDENDPLVQVQLDKKSARILAIKGQ